jgi:hypothetical protein
MVTTVDLIQLKLNRAKKHIDELKAMIQRYMTDNFSNVPAQIHVPTPSNASLLWQVQLPAGGLSLLAPVVGDALHNLRSALDHIAWQLVKANGGTPTGDTYFPILGAPPTPNRYGKSPPPYVSGGASLAVRNIIGNIQPYTLNPARPDDTDILQLHRLSIEDKHHGLILTPVSAPDVDFVTGHVGNITGVLRIDRTTDDGADLAFVSDVANTRVHGNVAVRVCLGSGLPGEGSPVSAKLGRFWRLVHDDVLMPLSARF